MFSRTKVVWDKEVADPLTVVIRAKAFLNAFCNAQILGVVARDAKGFCVGWLSKFLPDIEDIHWQLAKQWSLWLGHVRRAGNVVAHTLARTATSSLEGSVDPPMYVLPFFVAEYPPVFLIY
ncbi:hypothetical protein BUALT_Bualt17G0014600 [Buddleja alternifolia]|uniref:RNase H type-1 domain-containing protein n=1 Tax=Buddleja alternifolia TaxID=168488 RepID=A0AAV6W5G7_9LAMI|nr:hypothetical protein BUALT_Bualt17G0014600 [Buddleja alternifolia]